MNPIMINMNPSLSLKNLNDLKNKSENDPPSPLIPVPELKAPTILDGNPLIHPYAVDSENAAELPCMIELTRISQKATSVYQIAIPAVKA